jgi:hypothetical protein
LSFLQRPNCHPVHLLLFDTHADDFFNSGSNNVAVFIKNSVLSFLLDPIGNYFWTMRSNLLRDNAVTFVVGVGIFVVVELFNFPVFQAAPGAIKRFNVFLFALVAKVGVVRLKISDATV